MKNALIKIFVTLFCFDREYHDNMEVRMAQLRTIALAIHDIERILERTQLSLDGLKEINNQLILNDIKDQLNKK